MASKQPKISRRGQRRFLTFLKWTATIIAVGLLFGIGLFAWYAKSAPELTLDRLKSDGSSIIYDGDNNEITSLGLENRLYVSAPKITQTLADAVVSIEDRRFYKEPFGIDPIRIVSAAVGDVLHRGGGLQGGSTLTQQLVKLSYFSTKVSDQTIKRKAQEAWLAMKVEQRFSKEQILEYYINKVYMNYGQYGMATAADYYFDKSLSELSLGQTAFIAGLAQAPVSYDPYIHPEAATTRRNLVLNAMLRDKKITADQAEKAKAEDLTQGLVKHSDATTGSKNERVVDSYLTQVIKEVKKETGLNPYTAGLKIYTNLDMTAQRELYDIVNTDTHVLFPDDKLQTAVTMTNPENGRVLAQIGGRKTGDVKLAYNRAVVDGRSNGSNMKPLLDYGPAIEYLNQSTYTQFDDAAYTYPGTTIPVYNWDRQYQGVISMRTALVGSRNVPAVKALDAVGLKKGLNFLKGLGITLPENQQVISSAIGASVSTEKSAAAYGAFANGGLYYAPRYVHKITTPDGVSTSYHSEGSRAMKTSTAYMMTDMLKGVLTDPAGSGQTAAISNLYAAGKTGTVNYSDEELAINPSLSGMAKDAWFTGYTRNRVISVWAGYDKATYNGLNNINQTIPQLIYKALMTNVAADLPNRDWVKPSSVIAKNILIGSNPPVELAEAVSGRTSRELFVAGTTANISMGSFAPTVPSPEESTQEEVEPESSSQETEVDETVEESSSSSSISETPPSSSTQSTTSSVPSTSSSTAPPSSSSTATTSATTAP